MTIKQDAGYKYIFGPVPSRRLGMSLGVDVVPHKTCTLDCVYCECGKTTHLTVKRREYVPLGRVKEELETFLARDPRIDFITFSGAGEPTLHSGLGSLVRFIKTAFPQHKLALLTNGTLFYNSDVRDEIIDLDLVKISLDTVYKNNFESINRPHRHLKHSHIIDGLIALRKTFAKQFWIEVFVVPGYNDSEDELKKLKHVIDILAPDRVQLNTLDRPGTEPWVEPADKKALTHIAAYLYDAEIIHYSESSQNDRNLSGDFCQRLLATVKRRPCTVHDASKLLGASENEVRRHIFDLLKQGAVIPKKMPRGTFYMIRT
jgi:wyosine [tRNA(Phe)-imidazoG37] synthetase (radical SAM superfamily)